MPKLKKLLPSRVVFSPGCRSRALASALSAFPQIPPPARAEKVLRVEPGGRASTGMCRRRPFLPQSRPTSCMTRAAAVGVPCASSVMTAAGASKAAACHVTLWQQRAAHEATEVGCATQRRPPAAPYWRQPHSQDAATQLAAAPSWQDSPTSRSTHPGASHPADA